MGMSGTRRQQLAELLRKQKMTISEMAFYFETHPRNILEDLKHIEKSVASEEKLTMLPSRCEECDFVFKKRRRFQTPSRCPQCRSEKILDPSIFIKS